MNSKATLEFQETGGTRSRRVPQRVSKTTRLLEALESGDVEGIAALCPREHCVALALRLLLKAEGFRQANGVLVLEK
jgi:hypothetical protein